MSKTKKLAFLKVLTTFAWADGEISNAELNVLKSFYRKFDLNKEQIQELNCYLRAPLPKSEQEILFKNFIVELNSSKERKEIIKELEEMILADNIVHPEEKELLELFRKWLDSTSFTKRSLGKLRKFLNQTIFKVSREANVSLQDQFKNIIQKKFDLKIRKERKKSQWSGNRSYLACLSGILMASLGHADGKFSEKEYKVLKEKLGDQFKFGNQELSLLYEIVCDHAQDFDFYEVTTEFNRLVPLKDRLKFMESLFKVVIADGHMDHLETEELRRITKAMQISHKDFIDCKVRYRALIS